MQDLTTAVFQKKSLLAAIDPSLGKYMTVSVAYRGKTLSIRDSMFSGSYHSRLLTPQSKLRCMTSITRTLPISYHG